MPENLQATVILIRHAEKLNWRSGLAPTKEMKAQYIDDHTLSAKGLERSHALVGYFQYREEMQEIFQRCPLAAIIAQDVDSSREPWGRSERPKQTIAPLASVMAAKGVELLLYTKKQVEDVVGELLSGKFRGRTVIISWAHQQMPELAQALGVSASSVPKWEKGRFDVTWVVEPSATGAPVLKQFAQRLMYGDKDSIMPLEDAKQ
ncbi:hypothetical protein HDU85_007157 [Gaertneriomyces sp. JEL0708]|nr:hypothetical protein HDU85_007157 [Gaertneriomyces sp. JEL0708]